MSDVEMCFVYFRLLESMFFYSLSRDFDNCLILCSMHVT